MQLVGNGLIDLDKPVYQYLPKPLPEYSNYADLAGDERYKRITARMLLSDTSGFPNWRAFETDQSASAPTAPAPCSPRPPTLRGFCRPRLKENCCAAMFGSRCFLREVRIYIQRNDCRK
jgi:CubicO group peptidase (beta-lactamase class C family)